MPDNRDCRCLPILVCCPRKIAGTVQGGLLTERGTPNPGGSNTETLECAMGPNDLLRLRTTHRVSLYNSYLRHSRRFQDSLGSSGQMSGPYGCGPYGCVKQVLDKATTQSVYLPVPTTSSWPS